MRFDEVKELIKLIDNSDLSYFEVRDDKEFIKMDKSITRNYVSNSNDLSENSLSKLAITDLSNDIDINTEVIASPIVGTFYESMSPEDAPFVSAGQRINKGEVVCIVEAMKLMNEISAEFDCEIVSVLGENGKMVQYGDPLFKVRRV